MYKISSEKSISNNFTHVLYVLINDIVYISGVSEAQGKLIIEKCTGFGNKYYLEPLINPYKDKVRDLNALLWSDGTRQATTSDNHFFCKHCRRSYELPATESTKEWVCPVCGETLHSLSYGEWLLEESFTKMELPRSYVSEYDNDPYIKQMLINDLRNLQWSKGELNEDD